MQVENEHPNGWGTDANAYLKHLYDKARALGMEVPLYHSGMHHATDPAGNTPFGNRTYPWFSSEFWSGWFSPPFGEMNANDLNVLARGAWKVIAFGGGGNTFYVAHGGTNFGYGGDTATTSYDYRAPLGESGQFRQGYFAMRRTESFARAFEALLANSQDGGNVATVSSGLRAYVRKSPSDGVVVFLDNQGTSAVQTQIKLSTPALQFPAGSTQIAVAANESRPVVGAAPCTSNATFARVAAESRRPLRPPGWQPKAPCTATTKPISTRRATRKRKSWSACASRSSAPFPGQRRKKESGGAPSPARPSMSPGRWRTSRRTF